MDDTDSDGGPPNFLRVLESESVVFNLLLDATPPAKLTPCSLVDLPFARVFCSLDILSPVLLAGSSCFLGKSFSSFLALFETELEATDSVEVLELWLTEVEFLTSGSLLVSVVLAVFVGVNVGVVVVVVLTLPMVEPDVDADVVVVVEIPVVDVESFVAGDLGVSWNLLAPVRIGGGTSLGAVFKPPNFSASFLADADELEIFMLAGGAFLVSVLVFDVEDDNAAAAAATADVLDGAT